MLSLNYRSGTEEQYAEKEQLLQEIVEIQRDVAEEPKKKKKGLAGSQEREVAEVIRSLAMNSLRAPATTQNAASPSLASMPQDAESQSAVPLQSPTGAPSAKKRRLNKGGDDIIVAYLQTKQEAEAKLREEELAMKKKELDLADKKLDFEKARVEREQKEREERWQFEKKEREERMKLETEERRTLMDMLKTVILKH